MYKNNKMNYKEHTEHETQVLGLTKEDVGAIMDKMTR